MGWRREGVIIGIGKSVARSGAGGEIRGDAGMRAEQGWWGGEAMPRTKRVLKWRVRALRRGMLFGAGW